jgi:hypothetical protein
MIKLTIAINVRRGVRAMDIGKEQEEIYIEPKENPVPKKKEETVPVEPSKEEVHEPAGR